MDPNKMIRHHYTKEFKKVNNVTIGYTYRGFEDIEEKVESFEQLKKRLQEIKKQAATIWGEIIFSVDVIVENVGTLSIALDEKCILQYYNAVEDFYLTSSGDPLAEGNTKYFFGCYIEMSNKYIIHYDDALEELRFFINHGTLSDNVKWTD